MSTLWYNPNFIAIGVVFLSIFTWTVFISRNKKTLSYFFDLVTSYLLIALTLNLILQLLAGSLNLISLLIFSEMVSSVALVLTVLLFFKKHQRFSINGLTLLFLLIFFNHLNAILTFGSTKSFLILLLSLGILLYLLITPSPKINTNRILLGFLIGHCLISPNSTLYFNQSISNLALLSILVFVLFKFLFMEDHQ